MLEHEGTIRDPARWIYRTAFRVATAELKQPRPMAEPLDPPLVEDHYSDLSRSLTRLSHANGQASTFTTSRTSP